ncbi:hypothetical protein SAMN05660742_12225 [Propionispira arboris]|uniref:Uncharacterized protein n=1 Tax=Propionispira arboris TaxID=84035 RepID=A0A1H7CKN6_9FIRM|nr:hypothetical protein [Propionispira arboris]SEJ89167.1 hypothetical protein SAMN05660742_12225 [Propionispira arboris]
MENKHIYLPSTEAGESLKLTHEQEHLCKVVYKKTDDPKIYRFHDLWNPINDYNEEYIIVPVRSVFGDTEKYVVGSIFANIIGSNLDPNPSSSWLKLLTNNGIACTECVTDGKFYDPSNDTKYDKNKSGAKCECSTGSLNMVGGHVLLGQKIATQVGSGGTVNLIPICKHHNSYVCGNGTGNGTGFYMKTKSDGNCILLKNYLQCD